MNAVDPRHIITHARVLAIAVPMTIANVTTPLIGVVGTAVIGRLGEAHLLGAVAMSSVVFDCLFWLFAFLRMGTVALTAQALGAGDVAEERATLVRALVVAAAIGRHADPAAGAARRDHLPADGRERGGDARGEGYFYVRIWSAPFVFANLVLLGWFVGIAHAAVALGLQVRSTWSTSSSRRCWSCGSASA
jgi:MATE family multidrug resistance protein